MASWQCVGFVDAIKVLPDSCILFLSEYKKGYKRSDGVMVEEKYHSWKVIFSGYFIKYLTKHFGKGMLVEVKGDIVPYAVEHGNVIEGYSVIGQACNMFSYPRYGARQEQRMIKESQMNSNESPDLEAYNQPDF
jgi:hypothetical protein